MAARKGSNASIADRLNGFVSDSYVLFAKTQACHWNVVGSNFSGLHALFETQYRELFAAIDELAERVRALEAEAPLGIKDMLGRASIDDGISAGMKNTDMVRTLMADNKALSQKARELAEAADEEGDIATNDMLVSRIEAHDKAAWMLKAHLG